MNWTIYKNALYSVASIKLQTNVQFKSATNGMKLFKQHSEVLDQ